MFGQGRRDRVHQLQGVQVAVPAGQHDEATNELVHAHAAVLVHVKGGKEGAHQPLVEPSARRLEHRAKLCDGQLRRADGLERYLGKLGKVCDERVRLLGRSEEGANGGWHGLRHEVLGGLHRGSGQPRLVGEPRVNLRKLGRNQAIFHNCQRSGSRRRPKGGRHHRLGQRPGRARLAGAVPSTWNEDAHLAGAPAQRRRQRRRLANVARLAELERTCLRRAARLQPNHRRFFVDDGCDDGQRATQVHGRLVHLAEA
mmetsp:Transcript_8092/g.25864  ORF Transcript_8092/g.25864 Transcript_8092/m.25864 type:complete len:256 (-) Transcript_8092:1548-2315(-)